MKPTVLPDTSLCAIVRDEKMNPAGGIAKFVDSHVPFVEQAVIADTGSIDGTREILEEMQAKYPNLKVIDIPFEGYANARNRAMEHVKTRRVLVLDADELLAHKKPQNDWKILKYFVEQNKAGIYSFDFLAIPPNGITYAQFNVHERRLFDRKDIIFVGKIFESAYNKKWSKNILQVNGVVIKHFVPSKKDLDKKRTHWYSNSTFLKIPPSAAKGFAEWKTFNPLRDNYK